MFRLSYKSSYFMSHHLADKMDDCSSDDRWGNPIKCHCLYCAKRRDKDGTPNSCYIITTDKQKADMATVLDRYDNDDEQLRANLRWVTLLFSVYSFDLKAESYPTFPLDIVKMNPKGKGSATGTVMDAKKKAQKQLSAMRTMFPNMAWFGSFSWEVIHLDLLGAKKQETIPALIKASSSKGIISPAQEPPIFGDTMGHWRKHYITFHTHLVVDLRGSDEQEWRNYCHRMWGSQNKKFPIPDGVRIENLNERKVTDSLDTFAVYPFVNQWNYKQSKADKKAKVPVTRLEPEILSALINGTTELNKRNSITINNKWL